MMFLNSVLGRFQTFQVSWMLLPSAGALEKASKGRFRLPRVHLGKRLSWQLETCLVADLKGCGDGFFRKGRRNCSVRTSDKYPTCAVAAACSRVFLFVMCRSS